MDVLTSLKRLAELLLQAIVIVLMVSLAVVVMLGVVYRTMGSPLHWYDEVAPILLVWVTFYGAALAALNRQHIATYGILGALPPGMRMAAAAFAELCVFAFFILVAWYGFIVLEFFAGDRLVSLRWVPTTVTQSAIPVGAVLFLIAHALSLPEHWRRIRAGRLEEAELREATPQ